MDNKKETKIVNKFDTAEIRKEIENLLPNVTLPYGLGTLSKPTVIIILAMAVMIAVLVGVFASCPLGVMIFFPSCYFLWSIVDSIDDRKKTKINRESITENLNEAQTLEDFSGVILELQETFGSYKTGKRLHHDISDFRILNSSIQIYLMVTAENIRNISETGDGIQIDLEEKETGEISKIKVGADISYNTRIESDELVFTNWKIPVLVKQYK